MPPKRGNIQRRLLPLIRHLERAVCPTPQQKPDEPHIVVVAGPHETRGAVIVLRIQIGARAHQPPQQLHVAELGGRQQRRAHVGGDAVDARAPLQQQRAHAHVVRALQLGGEDERRLALAVLGVDGGAAVEEVARRVRPAEVGGDAQRRVLFWRVVARVDVEVALVKERSMKNE